MFSVYKWQNTQIAVYEPSNKQDLGYILEKYRFMRILYNGAKVYAWQADLIDHNTARKILSLSDDYIGFTIDKGQIVPSIESIKDSLLYRFITDFWKD